MNTTRREFLAATAAAPLSPILLGMQDKAGARAPVMGSGAHTYEAMHDWGVLPAHIKWGNTHGVVQDSNGHIYVHHTVHATSESPDSMVVFDDTGKFVRSWGKEFRGVAHGLHIQKEGRDEFLYLSVNAANPKATAQPEMHAVVIKATPRGEIVWKIQGPPEFDGYKPGPDGAPKRYNPTNLAVAPNGDVYVGDGYGSYFINQYNAKGEYLRSFGGRGSDPGLLLEPHGIWMDTRAESPVLVVADRGNIDFVSGFRRPCHFDEQQGTMVVPDLHGRVTLVDARNQVLAHLGDSNAPTVANPLRSGPRENFIPGQFICPHGACFDRDGNIFVAEWVEVGRVTKLRKV